MSNLNAIYELAGGYHWYKTTTVSYALYEYSRQIN